MCLFLSFDFLPLPCMLVYSSLRCHCIVVDYKIGNAPYSTVFVVSHQTLEAQTWQWQEIWKKVLSYGEISPNSPFLPNSPLWWYPSLLVVRANLNLWRNFVKSVTFAKFVIFLKFATLMLPIPFRSFAWILMSGDISSNPSLLPNSSFSSNSPRSLYPSL